MTNYGREQDAWLHQALYDTPTEVRLCHYMDGKLIEAQSFYENPNDIAELKKITKQANEVGSYDWHPCYLNKAGAMTNWLVVPEYHDDRYGHTAIFQAEAALSEALRAEYTHLLRRSILLDLSDFAFIHAAPSQRAQAMMTVLQQDAGKRMEDKE